MTKIPHLDNLAVSLIKIGDELSDNDFIRCAAYLIFALFYLIDKSLALARSVIRRRINRAWRNLRIKRSRQLRRRYIHLFCNLCYRCLSALAVLYPLFHRRGGSRRLFERTAHLYDSVITYKAFYLSDYHGYRVCRKLYAIAHIESFGGANQTYRTYLNQVLAFKAPAAETLDHAVHKPHIVGDKGISCVQIPLCRRYKQCVIVGEIVLIHLHLTLHLFFLSL